MRGSEDTVHRLAMPQNSAVLKRGIQGKANLRAGQLSAAFQGQHPTAVISHHLVALACHARASHCSMTVQDLPIYIKLTKSLQEKKSKANCRAYLGFCSLAYSGVTKT